MNFKDSSCRTLSSRAWREGVVGRVALESQVVQTRAASRINGAKLRRKTCDFGNQDATSEITSSLILHSKYTPITSAWDPPALGVLAVVGSIRIFTLGYFKKVWSLCNELVGDS